MFKDLIKSTQECAVRFPSPASFYTTSQTKTICTVQNQDEKHHSTNLNKYRPSTTEEQDQLEADKQYQGKLEETI
jgi:hypothetical protein